MTIPNLMPHQLEPFNGDNFICEEFLKLKEKYSIINAIETGTCLGGTTLWLADNFGFVHTVESNSKYLTIAQKRYNDHVGKALNRSVRFYLGDSVTVLNKKLPDIKDNTILFADAHWGDNCPLLGELKAISDAGIKPVIAIHDFKVPGSSLGFDSYNNQPFTIEWITPSLDAIYGEGEYEYYYNSDERSAGAKRGIIYITPK